MRLVLSSGLRCLRKYRSHFEQNSIPFDSELFTTIEQAPGFGTIVPVIPALLQRSRVWSFKHGRLLLPQEHLAVQGISLSEEVIEEATLCDMQMKSLAGNAMNFWALAAVVMHTLANIQRKDTTMQEAM